MQEMAASRVAARSDSDLFLNHPLRDLVCLFLGVVLFVQVISHYSAVQAVKVKFSFYHVFGNHILMAEFMVHYA